MTTRKQNLDQERIALLTKLAYGLDGAERKRAIRRLVELSKKQ